MESLTVQELVMALKHTDAYSSISDKELMDLACYIMGFFGFRDQIIDNILSPHDREIFFSLEEEGLLTSVQENSSIPSGKAWRIHYWRLKTRKIRELANMGGEQEEEKNIYDSIPDEAWTRNS